MATSPVWLCHSGVSLITSASSIEVTKLSNTFKAYDYTKLVHNVPGSMSKWKGFRADHSAKGEQRIHLQYFRPCSSSKSGLEELTGYNAVIQK